MLIDEFTRSGDHYRITQAGGSRRLYRNGVFHSQCRLHSIGNGGVWDMLWLPCFLHHRFSNRGELGRSSHKHSRLQILLLGVGMGAAIMKLRAFMPEVEITAIDIDPAHLSLAKKLLNEDIWSSASRQIIWVEADALSWIAKNRKRFDIVIDDLFYDRELASGDIEPTRVIPLDHLHLYGRARPRAWLDRLKGALKKDGILIANCESPRAVAAAYGLWSCDQTDGSVWGLAMRVAHYENRVAVFGTVNSRGEGFSQESWREGACTSVLASEWACRKTRSLGKSATALQRELRKLFDSIHIRRCP